MSRFVSGNARKRVGRAAMVAGAVGMVATGLTAAGLGTETASAATCLGGAKSWTKEWGGGFYVPKDGTWTTTSRCADINLKITTTLPLEVRVCFFPSSGGMSCQSSYKKVGSSWKVVASGVKDGTKFRLQFRSSSAESGHVAY